MSRGNNCSRTKDLVEAGNKCALAKAHALRGRVKHPHFLSGALSAANVRVGTQQNMLELGLGGRTAHADGRDFLESK
jgi:hypothetical protein